MNICPECQQKSPTKKKSSVKEQFTVKPIETPVEVKIEAPAPIEEASYTAEPTISPDAKVIDDLSLWKAIVNLIKLIFK